MVKRVSIASLLCDDDRQEKHAFGPSQLKESNPLFRSIDGIKEKKSTERGVSSRDGVMNCDGILSIKASRFWQGKAIPVGGRFVSYSFFMQQGLLELNTFLRSTLQIDKCLGETLGKHGLPNNNSDLDRCTIRPRPLQKQEESSFRGVSDVETTLSSISSQEQQSPHLLHQNLLVAKGKTAAGSISQISGENSPNSPLLDFRAQRKYRDARPSNFCHVCQKFQKGSTYAICSNIRNGLCRKVLCQSCFLCFGWDWNEAVDIRKNWCCPHCTDICPPRAQCFTYERTNNRRRLGIMKKRNFTKRKANRLI